MGLIAYITIKYLAYSVWCLIGMRRLESFLPRCTLRQALGIGLIPLLIGLVFGVVISLGSLVYSALIGLPGLPATGLVVYVAVYVPVRWVEWTLMSMIFAYNTRDFSLVGINSRDRLWRCGGVFISCVTDVPLIIVLRGSLQVGRFLG